MGAIPPERRDGRCAAQTCVCAGHTSANRKGAPIGNRDQPSRISLNPDGERPAGRMANGNWTVRLATGQLAAADGPLRHIETNPAGQIPQCQDVLRHDGNSSASMISGSPETKLARQNVTEVCRSVATTLRRSSNSSSDGEPHQSLRQRRTTSVRRNCRHGCSSTFLRRLATKRKGAF